MCVINWEIVTLANTLMSRRLQQEVQRQAMTSGHDVTPITMALMAGFQHSRAAQCLSSMLSRWGSSFN